MPQIDDRFKLFDSQTALETGSVDLHKLRNEILNNQSIQIGNVVHEYLSHIDFDSPEVRGAAYNRTLSKYGGLFPIAEIHDIIERVDRFLDLHNSFYNRKNWDKVFNEQLVFDRNGNEYRIDRLLINETAGQIMIIDYKTGLYHDQEQLDRYRQIIEELPVVKENNYTVSTEFIEIFINKENK
jgi:hypothetical protein